MLNQAEYISFSRINTYSSCKRKYASRYIDKLERLEPVPDYLSVGSVIDSALTYAQASRTETFDDYVEEKGITFNDEKWLYFCRGIWAGRKELYNNIFGDAKVELQKPVRIDLVHRETGEMILNAKNEVMYLFGYVDGDEKEKPIIHEIKSTAGATDALFTEHRFKGQTQLYALMTEVEKGFLPGVKYHYIEKPSRAKRKKAETEEQFYDRLFNIGKNPTIVSRPIIHYSRDEINETFDYYFETVKKSLDGEPCKNKDSCFQFGNRCEYFGHCWNSQVKDNDWIKKNAEK